MHRCTLHEAYETHQMRKCRNELGQTKYYKVYFEDNTNIGADALFDKKAVKTSLMSNYVKHWEQKIALEPKITFKYKCL